MATPKVKDYMTKDPVFLYVPGNRKEAMRIFVKETVSGIPVLREDDDKLVGIITRKDVFAKPHEDQLAMIMHKDPVSVHEDDNLNKAAKLMVDNNVHRLPVLDAKEKLVGVISPIDMLAYVDDMELEEPVERYMRRDVVPLHRAMPANVALEIMELTHAKALPVLDDDVRVAGMITDRDIYAQVRIDRKMVQSDLGAEGDEDSWTRESLRNIMKLYYDIGKVEIPKTAIEKVMVKEPKTVQGKTSVSRAARLMHRGRFNQLPVLDSNMKLIGMVYDTDLIRVLVK
jgi:CBS domain-containing protein